MKQDEIDRLANEGRESTIELEEAFQKTMRAFDETTRHLKRTTRLASGLLVLVTIIFAYSIWIMLS